MRSECFLPAKLLKWTLKMRVENFTDKKADFDKATP